MRYREAGHKFNVEQDEDLQDFYYNYKPWETRDSVVEHKTYLYDETYSKKEKRDQFGDKHFYELQFSNKGGLLMPLILEWTYSDGTTEIERIPVQVWRHNENRFSKVFIKDKQVVGVVLDPLKETADIDRSNNEWPVREVPTQFQVFKNHRSAPSQNPMQKAGMGKS